RHVDLHAEHLTARDEMLAEELGALGRDDELGDALDDVDLLPALAVDEEDLAGLAAHRDLEETRGEHDAVDRPAIDDVVRHARLPAERGARDEARELGESPRLAEVLGLARDARAVVNASGREELDEARVRERPELLPVRETNAVNLGRDVARRRLARV